MIICTRVGLGNSVFKRESQMAKPREQEELLEVICFQYTNRIVRYEFIYTVNY